MKKILLLPAALLLIMSCATKEAEVMEEPAPAAAPAAAVSEAPSGDSYASDFEDGTKGAWKERGSVTLTATDETAYQGSYSLLTTGRTSGWNGPSLDLTDVLKNGGTYALSVWVKIKEGQADSDLIMTIERKANGETGWDRVTEGAGAAGTWVNLSGEYTVAADYEAMVVYVESSDATLEYYIDSFSVVKK